LEAADQLLPGFDAEFAAAAQGELANHNVCVNWVTGSLDLPRGKR
jgi:NADH dehydrogenase FAD-containing subunit